MIDFKKPLQRALYQIRIQDIVKFESKVFDMVPESFVIPRDLVHNIVRTA